MRRNRELCPTRRDPILPPLPAWKTESDKAKTRRQRHLSSSCTPSVKNRPWRNIAIISDSLVPCSVPVKFFQCGRSRVADLASYQLRAIERNWFGIVRTDESEKELPSSRPSFGW